jgi:hypothetical protein
MAATAGQSLRRCLRRQDARNDGRPFAGTEGNFMTSMSNRGRALGMRLMQIAVIYLVVGMLGGLFMAATHQLQYGPVHAHMNLLGWATLAIAGLMYHVRPELAEHWLAPAHAWLHNIGLVAMTIGMAAMFSGRMEALPLAFAGSALAMVGVLLFAINLCTRLRS